MLIKWFKIVGTSEIHSNGKGLDCVQCPDVSTPLFNIFRVTSQIRLENANFAQSATAQMPTTQPVYLVALDSTLQKKEQYARSAQ